MIFPEYEVAGVSPLGSAYIFVRDKNINSVEKAAGQRDASDNAVVKEITSKNLQHSIIKKEDRDEPNQ